MVLKGVMRIYIMMNTEVVLKVMMMLTMRKRPGMTAAVMVAADGAYW